MNIARDTITVSYIDLLSYKGLRALYACSTSEVVISHVTALQIMKSPPPHNLTNFSYYCKYGILVFDHDRTGPADESKKTKRVQGWSRQIVGGGGFSLFAMLLQCEITTSLV